MLKEEYVKKHKELVDKINSYEKEIFLSTEEYIKSNSIYSDNEQVVIEEDNEKQHLVFIKGCGVLSDGEIFYKFYHTKKDGTISEKRFYTSDFNKWLIIRL